MVLQIGSNAKLVAFVNYRSPAARIWSLWRLKTLVTLSCKTAQNAGAKLLVSDDNIWLALASQQNNTAASAVTAQSATGISTACLTAPTVVPKIRSFRALCPWAPITSRSAFFPLPGSGWPFFAEPQPIKASAVAAHSLVSPVRISLQALHIAGGSCGRGCRRLLNPRKRAAAAGQSLLAWNRKYLADLPPHVEGMFTRFLTGSIRKVEA